MFPCLMAKKASSDTDLMFQFYFIHNMNEVYHHLYSAQFNFYKYSLHQGGWDPSLPAFIMVCVIIHE